MLAAVEERPLHTYSGNPYRLTLPGPMALSQSSPNLEVGVPARSEDKIDISHADTHL
jgi:hypothetical protein